MIVFHVSNVCSAFKAKAVGTKVIDIFTRGRNGLKWDIREGIKHHDTSRDKVEGQHYIVLPKSCHEKVSAGVGLKSDSVYDYVIRHHREGPKMYLKRERALPVDHLAVVVYTKEAYVNDPDYDVSEKIADNCTHVIVAVLASAGPAAPVTPYRFVHNLAGGNKEYHPPEEALRFYAFDSDSLYLRCEDLEGYITSIIGKAIEVKEYWDKYSVVAD